MKTAIAILFFAIIFTIHANAKSIRIGGEVFHMVESHQSQQSTFEEYIPKGQSLKSWTRLVSVRYLSNIVSPKDYMANMVVDYHRQYPHMKFGIDQFEGQWLFDCIMYPRGGGPKFVEWNFFAASAFNKGGIVVYQYAVRVPYKNSTVEAHEALDVKSLRQRMLPILKKSSFTAQP